MTNATIIPFQVPLPQALPTIEGNVDYRQFRDNFLHIDQLLLAERLGNPTPAEPISSAGWPSAQKSAPAPNKTTNSTAAALCAATSPASCSGRTIAVFAARLADSPLLQYFCGLGEVGCVKVPSKSTLQRYDVWWKETEVRHVIHQLLNLGATAPQQLHLPASGRFGKRLSGHHLPGGQHPLPGRLGLVARRHPHPDESGAPDPRPGPQTPDGRAGEFLSRASTPFASK